MLKTPIFITNFKNYEQSTGKNALTLAKIHEKVAQDTGVSIAIAVSHLDLYRISQEVSIPVFAQHIDPIDYGSFTGHVMATNVKNSGGVGTLLNHSERRVPEEDIINSLACAQKSSLIRIVCAENPEEVENFSQYDPDFLAFEPPELIGSSKASVASAKPTSIEESVQRSGGIPLLVGAGINSPEDIEISLKLGAQGFLVASAICKAKNPEKALKELVSVF